MAGIEKKSLDQPDAVEDFGEQGKSNKVSLGMTGESTLWRSVLEPGWSWQRNIKPKVPFESCPLHHREYVVAGRVRYVMDDGSEFIGEPGDHLLIEPGHQAEVMGNDTCVLLDW